MVTVQVTLSDSEAATGRDAAARARVTIEEFVRAATLLYIRASRDTYFRDVK